MNKKLKVEIIRTLIALSIAFTILVVIVSLISDNPLEALYNLFLGPISSKRNFGNVIEKTIPLIFTGLAVSLIFSSNNFNLASEGAFYFGGVMALVLCFTINVPSIIFWIILIIVSATVGAIIVGLPGYLKNKTEASEIVSSIMLNSIMFLLGTYILVYYFKPANSRAVSSADFPDKYLMPNIIAGTRVHFGLFLAIFAVLLIYLLMFKTKLGYKIRMTGKNSNFAKVMGINVSLVLLLTQLIGGALAGIGGAVHTLGVFDNFTSNRSPGYGWDGIIVAVLARNNPLYVPLAAFFVAYLKTGAAIMTRRSDVPAEIILVIQAIIILLIISKNLISKIEFKILISGKLDDGGAS